MDPRSPHNLRIAIIGSGVVGTATGTGLLRAGHDVVFCDVEEERVALLQRMGYNAIRVLDLLGLSVDSYLISVPSPTVGGQVDLSYVEVAARTVGTALAMGSTKESVAPWPIVVVRSTVPPGTTENVVVPLLEAGSGLRAGDDFGVAMNPEFLRAATAEEDFVHPRVIVIGALDERSAEGVRLIYASWADVPTVVTSPRTAEATKYLSNLFNAAKISFFNEMHALLSAIGADPQAAETIVRMGTEGLWNAEYGTHGGAPYGGVCLPKDTVGFLGFLEDRGLADDAHMLRATIETNDRMCAPQLEEAVDEHPSPKEGLVAALNEMPSVPESEFR
jgi:UDPglucose 6-dehydrogenase